MHFLNIDNTAGFCQAIQPLSGYPLDAQTIGAVNESDKSKLFFGEGITAIDRGQGQTTRDCSVYHGGSRIGAINWHQKVGNPEKSGCKFYSLRAFKEEDQARAYCKPKNIKVHSYDEYKWNDLQPHYGKAFFPTFKTLADLLDYTRDYHGRPRDRKKRKHANEQK